MTGHQFHIAAKAGRLRSGWAQGILYHAVPLDSETPLCSNRPAVDWQSEAGKAVTCPKCQKALLKYENPKFVPGVPEVVAF